ncbi:MAG TPA: helix-turn-helix transcriptional regulator [Streptomyces sp.]|nr:helix-turn-helix transcriptional regulator [Streptomyces sp.]
MLADEDAIEAAEAAEAKQAYAELIRPLRNPHAANSARYPGDLPEGVGRWLAERRLLDVDRASISSPERALRDLLGDQERWLRSATEALGRNLRALDEVIDLLPAARGAGYEAVEVEFFADRDRLRRRMDEFEPPGRRELLCMRTAFPGPEVLRASLEHDRKVLARGTGVRMLVTTSTVRRPGAGPYLDALLEAGAQVRTAPSLPLHLHVVDRMVTVLPAGDDPLGGDGDVLMHSPRIALRFAQVFEHFWTVAHPYPDRADHGGRSGGPGAAGGYSAQEREILALLASGAKDESIARRLGCSDRTLRRMMTQLMEKLGAESRFEAGVRAAHLGLVG